MPRVARQAPGGQVYHVLNRGVGRMTLFENDGDYAAFERVLALAQRRIPMRILGWCFMPNHWHLVLWPRRDGDLGRFMQRLTVTHVRRWQEHRHRVGEGHVYQGRFKSFVCQDDRHLLTLLRYVERNALRARLVPKGHAQDWRWGSLWRRLHGDGALQVGEEVPELSEGPVALPRDWMERVNRPENQRELEALRLSVVRGRPLGTDAWVMRMTRRLGLESAFRERGRPRKES